MPSLKKQKMQKAAAATAEEKGKLNNSNNNKVSSGEILLIHHHLTTCFRTFQAQAVQKQPSCEEGDEGLKSLVPMKPLFGAANGSDAQDAASGEGEGINVQLFSSFRSPLKGLLWKPGGRSLLEIPSCAQPFDKGMRLTTCACESTQYAHFPDRKREI